MKLSLIDKIKILKKLNTATDAVEEGIQMKNTTKVIAALFALITGLLQMPVIQTAVVSFIASHPAVSLTIAGISGILALIHNPKATATVAGVMLAICMMPGLVHAQAAPIATAPVAAAPAASLFTATAEATAFSYKSAWSVANHTTESFDLIDWGATKANSFAIEGHEITAPTPGYTIALGGGRYTPNIASPTKNTNIPAGSLGIYLQGAAGVTSAPTTHFAYLLGGGLQYRMSSTVTWSSLHVGYLRLGSKNAAEVSTGLQYFFK